MIGILDPEASYKGPTVGKPRKGKRRRRRSGMSPEAKEIALQAGFAAAGIPVTRT